MRSETLSAPNSKAGVWIGRILTALVVLFLAFDGGTKVMKERHVMAASAQFGMSEKFIVSIGMILLVSTALYAIPKTSILGVVLLTGYLGGAVAIQFRAGVPLFETIFPVLFAGVAWLGLYLREPLLRSVLPLRK
jgi:hypothetical protein